MGAGSEISEQGFTIEEIFQYLPHRYPFLMVDKVLGYQVSDWLTAVKNVTINEPYFTGHFPTKPVMPGVLMIEALAQAGGILAYLTTQTTPKDHMFYLASLNKVKFKQVVGPGDVLSLEVKLTAQKGAFWRILGEAKVAEKVVCSVEILSAMRKTSS